MNSQNKTLHSKKPSLTSSNSNSFSYHSRNRSMLPGEVDSSFKMQKEQENILRKFEFDFIFEPNYNQSPLDNPTKIRKMRRNIKLKTYVDGSKYEGEIQNDIRSGKGIYYYANGDKYLGDWKQDKFDGRGVYIFSNNERYEGELRRGLKHGYGVYFYLNGNKYEGEWTNDKKKRKGNIFQFLHK